MVMEKLFEYNRHRNKNNENQAIHLSVVATSRNDDHGGALLYRMQKFIDGFVEQCERHKLHAELILVEWNPPADRKKLRDALNWPHDSSFCELRIVTVPPQIHQHLSNSRELPLFQMIAKNVGIRRSRGKFILATNIDILFSDEIIIYMRDKLKKRKLYRANRWDVPNQLPDSISFSNLLHFCDRNAFRVHLKGFSVAAPDLNYSKFNFIYLLHPRLKSLLDNFLKFMISLFNIERIFTNLGILCFKLAKCFSIIKRERHPLSFVLKTLIENISQIFSKSKIISLWKKAKRPALHTNGCGDFTLLSKEDWFNLKGYPEWEIFSWHIDSVLLYQAYYYGLKEIDLDLKNKIFHIEHSIGSGYTEEGATKLFERLDKKRIPYLSYENFLEIIDSIAEKKFNASRQMNTEFWGMSQENLQDEIINGQNINKPLNELENGEMLYEKLC